MHLGPLRAELKVNAALGRVKDSFEVSDILRARRFMTRRVSHLFAPDHKKYFSRYQALEDELGAAIRDEMEAVKRWTTRVGT